MIKFFRKIRQRLLAENKLTRYLIYATGEIVLVVIGILIALQINNWNEQAKIKVSAALLSSELYNEYEKAGSNLKRSYEGIKIYNEFLENVIDKWHNLSLNGIDTLNKNAYAVVNFSTLFYLSNYSQFNDPRITIFEKSINEGTINLVESDFVVELSDTYSILNRLNEMITQEYDLGKAINLHIANHYNHILVDFKEEGANLDKTTLDRLLKAFRTDGSLKYLIKSRLDLSKIRMLFLKSYVDGIERNLKTFKHLQHD